MLTFLPIFSLLKDVMDRISNVLDRSIKGSDRLFLEQDCRVLIVTNCHKIDSFGTGWQGRREKRNLWVDSRAGNNCKQGMDLIDLRRILEGVIFGMDPFGGLRGCGAKAKTKASLSQHKSVKHRGPGGAEDKETCPKCGREIPRNSWYKHNCALQRRK